MKLFYTFLLFTLAFCKLNAQTTCMQSTSFEKWVDITDSIIGDANLPKNTFVFPENTFPTLRLLFAFFESPDAGTTAYTNYWKNVKFGIERDSSVTASGKYAIKMSGDKVLNLNDFIYTQQCSKIPTSITFSYRHLGTGNDSLNFLFLHAKENSTIPTDEMEASNFSSYSISSIGSKTNDAGFKKITIPVTKNFTDDADRFIVQFLYKGDEDYLATGAKSAFVIDDIVFNGISTNVKDNANFETKIYPNPASTTLNIVSSKEIASIEIFNTIGQNIQTISQPSSDLDVSNLNKGIYYMNIQYADSNVETLKFIKE